MSAQTLLLQEHQIAHWPNAWNCSVQLEALLEAHYGRHDLQLVLIQRHLTYWKHYQSWLLAFAAWILGR